MKRTRSLCGAMLLLLGFLAAAQEQNGDKPAEAKTTAGLSGIVTNNLTGEPLAHVEVWLLRKISGRFSSYHHTVTGADGRFSLTGIEAGSYFVSAERNGYHRTDVRLSLDPPMLPVKPGQEIKDILLKLEPDAIIAGHVVGAGGIPMEQVTVRAVGYVGAISNDTDDRGEFVIGGLVPGRYLLRASLNQSRLTEIRKDGSASVNYGVTYYPSAPSPAGATPVSVRAGQESNIEIKMIPAPLLQISGNVPGETGDREPRVVLDNWWNQASTGTSDEKGAFTFRNVPPGVYRLYAESWAPERRSSPLRLEITDASAQGLQLKLLPFVELAAAIRAEDWKQIVDQAKGEGVAPEIRLIPFGLFPDFNYSCKLSDQGRCAIQNVAPGRYHLLIAQASKNFYVKSVQVEGREFPGGGLEIGGPEKEEILVEVSASGAELSGTVRDAMGADQAVVVLLFDDEADCGIAAVARTAAEGSYVIRGIGPGKYKLLALDTKYAEPSLTDEGLELDRNVTAKIEVREGDRITQDLKIGTQ